MRVIAMLSGGVTARDDSSLTAIPAVASGLSYRGSHGGNLTRCDLLKGVAAAPAALGLGGLGASPAVAAPASLGILLGYAAGPILLAEAADLYQEPMRGGGAYNDHYDYGQTYGDERPESTRSEAEVPPLPLSSAQSAD
jgi:hypothetical protein